jgi:uncharacterized lipoprotein YmbA
VSIIKEQSSGDGYDALIQAQNKTLQKLSEEIAETILSQT